MWISCKYTYIPSLSPHPSHPSRSSQSRLGDELKLSIDACTRPCVKQLAGGSLLHSTVSSAQDSGFLIGLSASVLAPDRVSSTGRPQGSFQHLSQVSYMLVDCYALCEPRLLRLTLEWKPRSCRSLDYHVMSTPRCCPSLSALSTTSTRSAAWLPCHSCRCTECALWTGLGTCCFHSPERPPQVSPWPVPALLSVLGSGFCLSHSH